MSGGILDKEGKNIIILIHFLCKKNFFPLFNLQRILCGNSGKTDLRLSVMNLPKYMEFRTEPEVIKPEQEADIVISVDASKLVGKPEKFHAPLILDGVTGCPSDRTLSIEINLIDK